MKALEFKTRITENVIKVPPGIQDEIESSGSDEFRVIVLVDEDDNELWGHLAVTEFFNGYSNDDSIYDSYHERRGS